MASMTKGIFIVAAKRTPFGTFGGIFAKKTPVDLQEVAAKAAIAAANISPSKIDSVVIGNVISSASPDTPYISRHVALRCGIPIETPCLTINRLCGSGFQSIVNAAHDIIMGDSKISLAGGTDNMSLAPFIARDIRNGVKLGTAPIFEDSLWTSLTDQHIKTPMGVTAENLSVKYNISREEADNFAYLSQVNWGKGNESGAFADELCPVQVKTRKGMQDILVDEHPKPATTKEALAKLPTVFKKEGGTVTAGNASGICDGAGAVILASEEAVKENNLTPIARLVGYGIAGVDPKIMGIGPAPAIRKVLKATNVSLNDVDMVEINEAFAPQTVACQKELDLDPSKLNIHGGAIALGHPLAASGSRITAHVVHTLRKQNMKYGIGSACIGGGQGIALLIEKM